MIIDAHHHLWRFDPVEYSWIGEADRALRQDFLDAEFTAMAAESGLTGAIAVQARQTVTDTCFLLDAARRLPLIRGVVGWVPLADPELPSMLNDLADPLLVGVRHVVQGERDPDFLLRPAIQRGLGEVGRRGLVYDILIKAPQLGQAIRCVERQPELRFVLDHGGKPDIRRGALRPWAAGLAVLAQHPHVACKLSGLVTETDPTAWTPSELEPYVRTILDTFGPRRVLFGSDWPVCLLGTSHRRWLDTVRGWIAAYPASDQAAILGGNALTWYRTS